MIESIGQMHQQCSEYHLMNSCCILEFGMLVVFLIVFKEDHKLLGLVLMCVSVF